jgi:hypothetical protein
MDKKEGSPAALAGAHRVGNIELLGSSFDAQHLSPKPIDLQVFRIRERFHISWALARIMAELAYSSGRTR